MKVILSVEALAPALSGIGRYTWELASRLHEQDEIGDLNFFRNGQWIMDPAMLLHTALPLKAIRGRLLRHLKIKQPRWYTNFRLTSLCRGRVFHGPNYFLPSCADTGVVTVHDLSVFKFPETHPLARIKHFEREFERSIAAATHLITDSEVTRQEVINYLGWSAEKITAVHLGVSEHFAARSECELLPVLNRYALTAGAYTLCVSTFEPRKRIGSLLAAYRCLPLALRKLYPLVLVGAPGWLSETLHQEIDLCVVEGWLHYLGFIPEADLPILYAGARLFVYPSIYEGFGLPVLEALASGVPVVTSNRSSLPEVAQGAALLVDPDDVDALSKNIEVGLLDDLWRSEAVGLGLFVAQRYSWGKCVEQTVRVYQLVA